MSVLEAVNAALDKWPAPRLAERGVSVPTHCLYPSNSVVRVVVEGGENLFTVDDDAAAIDELVSTKTISVKDVARLIGAVVRPQGLSVSKGGAIYSRRVPADELEATIALVANASKNAAEHLLGVVKPPRRSLRLAIEQLLERDFKSRWTRDARVVGASNKSHKFDYVVQLNDDRQLLLDIVVPDASSINSAIVAHLDVRHGEKEKIEQRIIYDDEQTWSASDLALLMVGARAVPFKSFEKTLGRLAT